MTQDHQGISPQIKWVPAPDAIRNNVCGYGGASSIFHLSNAQWCLSSEKNEQSRVFSTPDFFVLALGALAIILVRHMSHPQCLRKIGYAQTSGSQKYYQVINQIRGFAQ